MPKHHLFNSDQEIPNLNSSRDEGNIETPRSRGKENASENPNRAQRPEKSSNPAVQPHSFPKPGAVLGNEYTQYAGNNINVNQIHSRPESQHVSDSDSLDETDFFSKGNSNVKLPYTLQEDEFIIKYVLKGQNIFRASSVSLWRYLETKKENPKRTYQSLKNRFLKSIKPRLFTTYSYLIKDKETENIILEKYPDLRKRGVRKDVFSTLNLPRRPEIMDFSDDDSNPSGPAAAPSSVPRNTSNQNQNSNISNKVDVRKPEQRKATVPERQNVNRVSHNEVTHLREVMVRKDETLVTVKFISQSLSKNPSKSPPVGIYSKFLKLKNQNKLVPCPTCSKPGFQLNGAEKNAVDTDSDTDNFIPNSIEPPKESNSKTPSGSNRVKRSAAPSKEPEKSANNSKKSKGNSKDVKTTPKNSNPRDSAQNSPATKGGKTTPTNSNASNLQNSAVSKELKQLLEDSYSRNIIEKMLPKNGTAETKRKINPTSQSSNKSAENTSKGSQQAVNLQSPPSRNLRKSVRKRVVKKGSSDLKTNIATRKQPKRNVDAAKPTTSSTTATTSTAAVVAEGSGSRVIGEPFLRGETNKSINNTRQVKKRKTKSKAYKLPLRISALTHRERFLLRKVLRRTYRIYRRNLLQNNKKSSKALKKKLKKKKKQKTREQKKTNLKSQSESDSLNDNFLRSLYKETVSECRKLVNSDEEERRPDQQEVRNNNRRHNNTVTESEGFDSEHLKSFFMESESEMELTNSSTQNTKSDLNDTASSSLAENMMKMLSRF